MRLCAERNIKRAQLCRETGVSTSAMTELKKGRTVSLSAQSARRIADFFGVSVSCLFGDTALGVSEAAEARELAGESPRLLPLLGEIACGEPRFASQELYAYVPSNGVSADFCLRAKGDSMTGARINDGDVVFIKKQESVENGQIAAVAIDDEATLKRVYVTPENVTLVAENPAYPPIVLDARDAKSVRILGRAVAFQSSVR
jgi:repressor LexA